MISIRHTMDNMFEIHATPHAFRHFHPNSICVNKEDILELRRKLNELAKEFTPNMETSHVKTEVPESGRGPASYPPESGGR